MVSAQLVKYTEGDKGEMEKEMGASCVLMVHIALEM
jgi:hypothetical protein